MKTTGDERDDQPLGSSSEANDSELLLSFNLKQQVIRDRVNSANPAGRVGWQAR